ncbi:hypothetical protein [Streptomyces sp. NBRC 109706]|uniref:hypothetical protein n=1 Tax=Streptomyces sp. NBRC 109706 TaxID=1550035 RepID=UPI0007838D7A|nr:hypothetical protein [Streptomyces sp. NBRC 109706]
MASRDQQVREIVEGLGLGLVALGASRVTSQKIDLEFAFSYAWRRWPHADQYPSIGRASKPDNLFWRGVTRSERRKSAVIVWRGDRGEYAIGTVHDGWMPEDAVGIIGDRLLSEWVSLATDFRERLEGIV